MRVFIYCSLQELLANSKYVLNENKNVGVLLNPLRPCLLIIGGASTASEATLSSSPLRFAVYVGLVRACNQSLRQ